MTALFRRLTFLIAFVLVAAYGYIALRGPQGIPALLEKRREIRQLEEENANLRRDVQYRQDRIYKLKKSTSVQEQEIRKQFHMLRPGETEFVVPDQPKPSAPTPEGRAATEPRP